MGCWLPARRCDAEPGTGQQVVGAIYHSLMAVDSALRLSAQTQLRQVTKASLGPDFTLGVGPSYH